MSTGRQTWLAQTVTSDAAIWTTDPPGLRLAYMLRCEECGKIAFDDAKTWRAYLAYDPREDDAPYVAVYCPTCAEREFLNPSEITPARVRPLRPFGGATGPYA